MLYFIPSSIVVFAFIFGLVKFCEWIDAHPAIANMNIFALLGIIFAVIFVIIVIIAAIACKLDNKKD